MKLKNKLYLIVLIILLLLPALACDDGNDNGTTDYGHANNSSIDLVCDTEDCEGLDKLICGADECLGRHALEPK